MKTTLMPKTSLGKLTVKLGIISLILMVILIIVSNFIYRHQNNTIGSIIGPIWALFQATTLIVGIISVLIKKEGSVIIFLFILFSILILLFSFFG